MMKRLLILLFVSFLIPSIAFAGEVFGTIKNSNGEPVFDVKVEIKKNDKIIVSTKTDKYGSYRITLRETGKYSLVVYYKGEKPGLLIYSTESSSRYNLILEKNQQGKYILIRR